ncbi:MAG: DNA-directed DNA polymerase II small subunit [Candidatus Thorarchaeota archaeon]
MNPATRKTVLKMFIKSGLQIAPDALELISTLDTPIKWANTIIQSNIDVISVPVISRSYIEKIVLRRAEQEPVDESTTQITSVMTEHDLHDTKTMQREPSQETIRIIKSPSIDMVGSLGQVEDFHELFIDRFHKIKKIYMGRIDTRNAIPIRAAIMRKKDSFRIKALKRGEGKKQKPMETKVIGMVKSKSISRSRNIIIELEDEEATMVCVIPSGRKGLQGQELSKKGEAILLDEVICISGYVDQDGRLIADEVLFPDVPAAREIGRSRRNVYAAFISDLHCGSKEFLEEEFDRFIEWMRGKDVPDNKREIVEKTEYLFIAGDLVDGVGVYPGQEKDLIIPSIHDQYELLAKKLGKLPKHIKIISIPGNHDACRQALPKPPIPEEFAEALYSLGERVMMLGDPSLISVEGVKILMTHGDSLDDLVTQIPGASYRQPALPMIELLKKRHLVPMYGGKTELAPLHKDWMVIDKVPDIVHFGHAHHNAVNNYRGIQVINSGTFQSQTDFMKKQGVVPTPGIVTFVNLRNGSPTVETFFDFSKMIDDQ